MRRLFVTMFAVALLVGPLIGAWVSGAVTRRRRLFLVAIILGSLGLVAFGYSTAMALPDPPKVKAPPLEIVHYSETTIIISDCLVCGEGGAPCWICYLICGSCGQAR